MKWDNEKHNYLVDLRLSDKYTWQQIAEEMTIKFPFEYTAEQCRSRWRQNRHKLDDIDTTKKYKETVEIKKDNTQVSDRLIEISEQDLKDEKSLLSAHGYNPTEWELTNSKSSMWQHHNKKDGTKTLYASKITVKPKEDRVTLSDLAEVLKDTKPIEVNIPKYKIKNRQLLEITLFDQHFGIATYDDYKETQSKLHTLITSRVWEEILITIGSDMLHHNDHKNRTASGREIEHVDMVQAWEEARKFYEPLIEKTMKQSNNIKIIYVKGNHDESLSWCFTKMLEAKYPQIEFDTSFEERKAHMFDEVMIVYFHGDKSPKRVPRIIPAEFPKEWAKAKVREGRAGHIHHEVVKDEFGLTMRNVSTRVPTDQWHKDYAWIGAHKRFMVFEYSTDELVSIHYV